MTNGNGYRFFTRSGRPLDKATYLAQLEGRNQSIGNLIRRARVSAVGVRTLPINPSNRYTALFAPSPATPFGRYGNYLVLYLYEDVWLLVPPARVGIVQHEYLGIEYSYDRIARQWDPSNLSGSVTEPTVGGGGSGVPDKLGTTVTGSFAPGNYVSFGNRSGIFPITGTRTHALKLGMPVFFTVSPVPRGILGFTTDLSKIGLDILDTPPDDPSPTDLRASTGVTGGIIPRGVPISLLGAVVEERSRTTVSTSEQTLYTTHGLFRQDILPLARGAVANPTDVYFHFLRVQGSTDWFAYAYSSLNTSADLVVSGNTFNRRSLRVSTGLGLTGSNYIELRTSSDIITLP